MRRQFVPMEEEGRGGDSAAGFGNKPGIPGDAAHCLLDLLLGHGDDLLDVALDVREVQIAQTLGA